MLTELIDRSKTTSVASNLPLLRRALLVGILALGIGRAEAQPPQIALLAPPQLWQRAEFRVDHAPTATNCFDPDLIRLDATFTAPSGRSLSIPGFWYQDFSRALRNGAEVLTPVGDPHWRIRFTPTEPGDHTLSLSIQTNGAAAGRPIVLRFSVRGAAPSGQHGFVRLAPDERYFETSDGRALRLIGHNVCWGDARGTFDYDAWFPEMKNAGENFGRLWLAPWFMGLEHRPGTLNHYDLQGAWQLDYIFRLAEQNGIYLMLCFDHHGMYQSDNLSWGGSNNFWKTNPYNEINGGPCGRQNDFFTNAQARALYQKRLRYLLARYGGSPFLQSWQFFNEIDNVFGPLNGADVLAWHREMGQWFRAHDPYHHLVTTSLTGGSERPEVWLLPELDFSIYHSYGEPAPGRGAALLARSFVSRYGKPMMVGEFGVDARSWNIAIDPHLRGFRQAQWGGALGGSVGTSMSWWWQDMHADRVYPLFAAMNNILRQAGWHEGAWTPVDFDGAGGPPVELAGILPAGEPFNAPIALNAVRRLSHRMPGELAVANRLAAERGSESLSAYLRGSKEAHLQRSIKLTAFFGEKGRLALRVRSVASDATLVARVDGAEVLRTNFAGADAMPTRPRDVSQDFALDLSPGKRVIEIANEGSADWILLDSLRLEQVQPAEFAGGWTFGPESVGLRQGTKAVLYVCSPCVVYPAGALRYNPPLQSGQAVRLAAWPAGRFSARWFDPRTGKTAGITEGDSAGSLLALPVPAFSDDLAAIITPVAAHPPED